MESPILQAFVQVLAQPEVWLIIVASAFYGVFLGAVPGLTATMAVALFVPITYWLDPIPALAGIVTMAACAIFAGDIPTTLLRIPGTPASAAYVDDAYTYTQRGESDRALGVALIGSVIGGLFGAAGRGVEAGGVAAVDRLQVGTGAEHRALVGQHADPDGLVGLHAVDGGLDALRDVTVHGVPGLGSVDGDDGDVATGLVLDHGRTVATAPQPTGERGCRRPVSAGSGGRRYPAAVSSHQGQGRLQCPYCDSYEIDRLYLASLRVDSCVCTSCGARWDEDASTGAFRGRQSQARTSRTESR